VLCSCPLHWVLHPSHCACPVLQPYLM
jgi:hypothetical protein